MSKRNDPDVADDPDGPGGATDDVGDAPDGPERMRAAGVGVGLGGVLLGVAAVIMPFHLAAGVVASVAVGILLVREHLPVGYAIGVGAVGGLGLDAFTLAALAVVFGLLDAVSGVLLSRRR